MRQRCGSVVDHGAARRWEVVVVVGDKMQRESEQARLALEVGERRYLRLFESAEDDVLLRAPKRRAGDA